MSSYTQESTQSAKIAPNTLSDEIDVDNLCLNAIHELMKDDASRKKPSPRDIRAQKRAQLKLDKVANDLETRLSNLEDPFKIVVAPPVQDESLDSTCKRTEVHPIHVISTAIISPDPLETWPYKQDVKDIKNLIRLTPDQIKKGYPSSLIMIRDDKSRDGILAPKCQRQRLVVKEHGTKPCSTKMENEFIINSSENIISPIWSMRLRQSVKHATHARLLKSDDRICRLLSNMQTKRTFLYHAKHMA
jgi:hypothetical protein